MRPQMCSQMCPMFANVFADVSAICENKYSFAKVNTLSRKRTRRVWKLEWGWNPHAETNYASAKVSQKCALIQRRQYSTRKIRSLEAKVIDRMVAKPSPMLAESLSPFGRAFSLFLSAFFLLTFPPNESPN